ncbi:MAG: BMP family ABC transporter substrate-binding protein [Eubacteriales bacterium]|nr:BMP family ABC transporter substrate-binding protein [Eubacteriales bacterium]MDD4323626.1 BMP family ABC transporter substrate-binding protein [Eubacteriales bacterium]MDD4540624.1 BMP family ABC transporter substrate-binding protein [Eubacteriales bacterium]
MKKWLAIILSLVMIFSLFAACAPSEDPDPTDAPKTTDPVDEPTEPVDPSGELTLENIKVGFVHITDPSDQGYTYNHNRGTEKMVEVLGLREDQVINKFNIPETSECENALRELVEQGCNIIFATSFGHEQFVLKVAEEHPEVEFCHATGYQAGMSGLDNMHNYFGSIYEARYLSGIAAGLKTESNKLGYVAAQPFAECISGFTGFYLGALSVNPDVTMEVKYTYSWHDPVKEAQMAQALIDSGADVIGQHADSTACATTAQQNGVFHVGYNADMRDAAPDASLTSAVWDWSIYLQFAIETLVAGEEIPTDWSQGLAEGAVDISPLNESIVAEGTAEAIEEARERIVGGWGVFSGPLRNNEGEIVVEEGETFIEPASAPSWEHILEGITVTE